MSKEMNIEESKWEFYGKDKIIIGCSIFTLDELQERFKKLLADKGRLKEENNYLRNHFMNYESYESIELNYISKDKIKEKIEWLTDNILNNDYASENDKDIAEYQVNVLEELLKEGE